MPTADDLLRVLDPEQREVATTLRGPLRVLAGAGTGKTRAITHRIAYGVATGVYNPSQVLAVTFTTRAGRRDAGTPATDGRRIDPSTHLPQCRATAGSLLLAKGVWCAPPELISSKLGLVALAARSNRAPTDQSTLRDLASEIEWAKVTNTSPDTYPSRAKSAGREVSGVDLATVAHVFGSYEEHKREQGRMDMEDVLLLGAALLTESAEVAATVRRQYTHFVVDEFQDLSPIQSALLDLWLGGRDEICVVGDPATIHLFVCRTRDSYLLDFPAKFPGTTSVDLVRNYRSTPQVVSAANDVLRAGSSRALQLKAQAASGLAVSYTEHPDEVAEADAITREISRLRREGLPLREMAVLFGSTPSRRRLRSR